MVSKAEKKANLLKTVYHRNYLDHPTNIPIINFIMNNLVYIYQNYCSRIIARMSLRNTLIEFVKCMYLFLIFSSVFCAYCKSHTETA